MFVVLATLAIAAPELPSAAPACVVMMGDRMPLDRRQSKLDSVSTTVGGKTVKICYGRPALRGRKMIGSENVPYGKLWRTGANEPTMIHTEVPLVIAGIKLEPGSYSLYTVPGQKEWEVIVNRSITQWGHESAYTDKVKAMEVGRGKAPAESVAAPVELLTFTFEGDAKKGTIVLEWDSARVRIPYSAS